MVGKYLCPLLLLIGSGCGAGPFSGCDPGWDVTINDPDVCCPLDALFAGSDGVCYASSVRDACDVPDSQLQTALVLMRLAREEGYSATEMFTETLAACNGECHRINAGDDCFDNCDRCVTAVVGAVYR